MTDLNRLEQLAKDAKQMLESQWDQRAWDRYLGVTHPETILALIQRIRELESMSKETK